MHRSRVCVVAPSSPFAPDRLTAGTERLRGWGFDVVDSEPLLRGRHAYLNGSDEQRAHQLQQALDSDHDIVWLARGGYGLTRLLNHIHIAPAGPLVVGFSDATALHALLWRAGRASLHGPLATTLGAEPDDSADHLLALLRGGQGATLADLQSDTDLDVTGRLFAANLCVLTALCGTPHLPDLRGSILVLEEIGERPYRLDRMLTQLIDSGALNGVAAVVVGHLTGCEEPAGAGVRDDAPRAVDVFRERFSSAGIPVVTSARMGHEAPNFAVPCGVPGRLWARDGSATLRFEGAL